MQAGGAGGVSLRVLPMHLPMPLGPSPSLSPAHHIANGSDFVDVWVNEGVFRPVDPSAWYERLVCLCINGKALIDPTRGKSGVVIERLQTKQLRVQ